MDRAPLVQRLEKPCRESGMAFGLIRADVDGTGQLATLVLGPDACRLSPGELATGPAVVQAAQRERVLPVGGQTRRVGLDDVPRTQAATGIAATAPRRVAE